MKVKYFLSLTDSESESGYSISSLFVKYRTQLVGYYWAEVFGKEFPLQFSFNQMDDVASISVDGAQTLDLTGADTFVALVPKTGPCTVADAESELTLQPGELVLVPAVCKGVTLQGHCLVKSIKCVN